VAEGRPTISTHVLDTGAGAPAAGVGVTLHRLESDGSEVAVGGGFTDDDGRIRALLEGELTAGAYRIGFDLGGAFFTRLTIDLRVDDASRSYHVPLLLAPYGMTTYRGS
jgi:5-hydroxyisourate hydrolase